ncbi:MAG: hypothetical protein A3G24_10660 [Betaproteobacteria bacterium RIFCSPLOWO2_12_FULL_62_13]|nr:MAG: hypothetical protein A3G24_10660 [Betaproteobacteria bacterium RIFCSPLOWO2_12_FULL_62_13]
MIAASPNFVIGADIGGTFTDIFALDLESGGCATGKVLTDHADPANSVAEGLRGLIESQLVNPAAVSKVLHATTLVTNALIQRRGAKTALLVTEGFRDAIEIGTEHRFDLYDLDIEKPAPLAPRSLRRPIRERILADGSVALPLDEAQVRLEIQGLLAEGVQSFAVCLLHGYRNPVHEQRVRDIIRQLSGEVHVSISSEVAPEIREYERASTTLINAYVAPIVGPYLRALRQRLESLGIGSKLLIMQSNGGTATPDTAQRFPVRLLESGPSAGAIGAAYLARETQRPKILFFDMGGTTAKAFIIDDGHPLIARKLEVAHVYRFKHGSGLPVQIPAIDMIEIGAGGGSIARIDRLGLLKVGPESAESDPGPACYGLGGTLPTVTDADLILGYLSADNFLGGRMRLDEEASRKAIHDHIATPLGLSIEEAAWGIHHVVNENMASAARVHLLEHAKSPNDYSMVAFGGAGPVHAYGVARVLRQKEVIVPWQAGVGSAYGMLCAPVSFEVARSLTVPITEANWADINRMLDEMVVECRHMVEEAGIPATQITWTRSADMRYRGQGHEIQVDLENLGLPAPDLDDVLGRFRAEYRRLNAVDGPIAPVDAVTWRAVASGPVPRLPLTSAGIGGQNPRGRRGRRIYFHDAGGYLPAQIVPRETLVAGERVAGPAVIELGDASITVGPLAVATVREDGLIVMKLNSDETHGY